MSSKIMLHGEPLSVGDKVWHLLAGWGTVVHIAHGKLAYPVKVEFSSDNHHRTFTAGGKEFEADVSIALYWAEVSFAVPHKPVPPVYEYQVLFLHVVSKFVHLSKHFYSDADEFRRDNPSHEVILVVQESKRVRKP